jgi:uncharacterized protein (PEP-CTERM system associated)
VRIIISAPTRSFPARRRGTAVAAALALCAVSASGARSQGAPPAQTLLPPYGADVRVGNLRDQFARVFDTNPPAPSERAWTFTPSLDISETYDSAVLTPRGSKSDFITRVSPGFALQVATPRLTGSGYYSPTANIYASNGSQNAITHNLNAAATATLVEDLLFADLRGYAAVQPILGGFVYPGSTGNTYDQMQTESFSISPYLRKRFGDTATVVAGYSLSRTMNGYLDRRNTTPLIGGLAGNYTGHHEHASITTGSDFGRIMASLAAVASQYEGSSLYDGAHNETFTLSTGYAVTRTVTLTASIGHENIVYGKSAGLKPIEGLIWSGGVHLTPNADSVIDASYGHREGADSFYFNGNYAVTGRLHLLGRYSEAVGTGLQYLQNALAGTIVGPGGVALDASTLAPVQLYNILGQQQGIYRTTSASVTGVLQYDRDTFTLGADYTERKLLSAGSGPGYGTNDATTATFGWQHQLSETMSANLTLQYGVRQFPQGTGQPTQDSTIAAASLSLYQQLSQTLSSYYSFSHSQTSGAHYGLPATRDLAIIGLHKTF